MKRYSFVNELYMNSVSNSSVIEVGDSKSLTPVSRVFALQREYPMFYEGEASFKAFPIFTDPIPKAHIYEPVHTSFIHENPAISVDSLRIIGTSSSVVIQVGSTETIQTESRLKHIRHFLNPPNSTE